MSLNLTDKLKTVASQNGIILLYHSIADSTAVTLQRTLHNVHPQSLQKHLEQVSEFFRFVSLKEFSHADQKLGLAAITFDDGYKNVLQNGLPVLEKFNYPFTLFLNPVTFDHHWNWRDKVRYLIHHDLIDDFEQHYQCDYKQGRFYRYSKHPNNNSAELDHALDRFLLNHQIDIYPEYPYLLKRDLIDHSLITYGNHSFNHYVLTSLSSKQQKYEIETAKNILSGFPELKVSNSFSVPFGGANDISAQTVAIVESLGYTELLMSRQQLQPGLLESENIQVLERFMPRSDDIIGEIAAI